MISSESDRADFKLSEQDVYLFVLAKSSNAMSLVAAFDTTQDKEYLQAAVEKFPHDSFVLSRALVSLELGEEQRAKMIEDFKKSAPANAFANFLAARDALKRGDTEAALRELQAAKDKGYEEYFRDSLQGLEEAYASVGMPDAEAKILALSDVSIDHLPQIKNLGKQLINSAEKAAAKGDVKTQEEILAANWEIGNKLRGAAGSAPAITELVGIAVENATLRAWPAGAPFDGRPAADSLAANNKDRGTLNMAGPAFMKWAPAAPDEEIVRYTDILKASGQRQALKWLINLHPELENAGRESRQ